MNTPDDDTNDLHGQLARALGAEPPMRSLPHDDLARGRRTVRRRRVGALTGTVAAVSTITLGSWALSNGVLNTAGPSGTQLAPAGAPGAATDGGGEAPMGTLTAVCSADPTPAQLGGSAKAASPGGTFLHSHGKHGASVSSRAGKPTSAGGGAMPLRSGKQHLGANGPVAAITGDNGNCDAVPGEPVDTTDIDRVTKAMDDHVDPDATHEGATDIAGGSVSSNPGSPPSGLYVGREWVAGDAAGAVSLSVESADLAAANGDDTGCADPSVVAGPDVTCEQRTLADGTVVTVGRGEAAGAQRIVVRYDEPDGTIVWATADAATEQWWTDQSGAAPLDAPPVGVDALISLVQDPAVHL